MDRSERYDLGIEVGDGQDTITRDVTLTLQAETGGGTGIKKNEEENREAELEAAIDNMISSIEYSREKKIQLPLKRKKAGMLFNCVIRTAYMILN